MSSLNAKTYEPAPSQHVAFLGLGVMGYHSFLQSRGVGFESALAKSWNMKFFKHIRAQVDEASMMLANERGACPDAEEMGVMERFSCKMAIAPTATIANIAGSIPGNEPIYKNIYVKSNISGDFVIVLLSSSKLASVCLCN